MNSEPRWATTINKRVIGRYTYLYIISLILSIVELIEYGYSQIYKTYFGNRRIRLFNEQKSRELNLLLDKNDVSRINLNRLGEGYVELDSPRNSHDNNEETKIPPLKLHRTTSKIQKFTSHDTPHILTPKIEVLPEEQPEINFNVYDIIEPIEADKSIKTHVSFQRINSDLIEQDPYKEVKTVPENEVKVRMLENPSSLFDESGNRVINNISRLDYNEDINNDNARLANEIKEHLRKIDIIYHDSELSKIVKKYNELIEEQEKYFAIIDKIKKGEYIDEIRNMITLRNPLFYYEFTNEEIDNIHSRGTLTPENIDKLINKMHITIIKYEQEKDQIMIKYNEMRKLYLIELQAKTDRAREKLIEGIYA